MSFLPRSSVPAQIRDSELAESVSRNELRRLDQIATLLDINAGRRIIAESTPGRECFVVVDGEFAITGPGVEATVGAGEIAGELALLTGRPRNATVVASSDAAVYVMHPREFATLLSQAPQFCTKVVSTANQRLENRPVSLPAQFVNTASAQTHQHRHSHNR